MIADLRARILARFAAEFARSPDIRKTFRLLENRAADYADAQRYAIAIGDIVKDCLRAEDYTGVNLYELADLIGNIAGQNDELVDMVCDTIQGQMNESVNIGIKPITPGAQESRIAGIKQLVQEADGNNAIYNAVTEGVVNTAQARVDQWVKTNAEFQAKSGLGATIVRVWSGSYPSHDTRHTDYCRQLAGVYQYRNGVVDSPNNVFARHEGCRCTVSYYPAGTSHGTITALSKGERDENQVLWNTGKTFSYSPDAIRRRERNAAKEAASIINKPMPDYNGEEERHF